MSNSGTTSQIDVTVIREFATPDGINIVRIRFGRMAIFNLALHREMVNMANRRVNKHLATVGYSENVVENVIRIFVNPRHQFDFVGFRWIDEWRRSRPLGPFRL